MYIGELAKKSGASRKAIYLYEQMGLIQQPVRKGSYRVYASVVVDQIQTIRCAQEAMLWAEHIVFIYPIWWGSIPAILKGFFDRILLPGFAFKFRPGALMADGLLAKRTAHLIATMDTPPWYYRLVYRMPGHNQMKRTILEFCGIKPVAITNFGPVKTSSKATREKWLLRAYTHGQKT